MFVVQVMRSNKTVEAYNFDEVMQGNLQITVGRLLTRDLGAFPLISYSSPLPLKHGDRTGSYTFS